MNHWKIAAVVVLIAGLAGAACTSKTTTVVSPPGTQTGISVSGTGRASGTPDVVILQVGVQSEARTVAAARDNAAQAAQAVIDSVKRNGVDEKDVHTVQFSVEPQYDFTSTRTQVLRAYRVTNVVQVKVRRIVTAGKVIDDAVAAGGDQTVVRGISFSIEDTTKLEEAARSDAVEEARKRAEQLAKEAGVSLGKPLTISEGGSAIPIAAAPLVAAPRTGDTVQTSIQPGELEVRVTVSILYAIE